MNLAGVLGFFHTETFTNLSGTGTFLGQVLVYDDATSSGPTSKRRILEVAAGVSFPTDRTIIDSASSQKFLVGSVSDDWWEGSVIARKAPILPISTQFNSQTIDQVLASTAGTSMYGHLSFLRRIDLKEASDFYNSFDLFFPSYYSIPAGQIVSGGGGWFRARSASRVDDIGFGVVEVVALDSPLVVQTITTKVLDPDTDIVTPTSHTNVSTFVEPFELDYFHEVLGFINAGPGDQAVSFLKTGISKLSRGDSVGSHGLVMTVIDNGTFWTAMVRRNSA